MQESDVVHGLLPSVGPREVYRMGLERVLWKPVAGASRSCERMPAIHMFLGKGIKGTGGR